MAHFIDFQVGVENPTDDPDVEVSQYWDSLKSFIDDGEDDAVGRGFYHKLENFNISVDETLEEEYKKSLVDIQNLECSNFCETSEEKDEVDELQMLRKEWINSKKLFYHYLLKMKMKVLIHLSMLYFLQ